LVKRKRHIKVIKKRSPCEAPCWKWEKKGEFRDLCGLRRGSCKSFNPIPRKIAQERQRRLRKKETKGGAQLTGRGLGT